MSGPEVPVDRLPSASPLEATALVVVYPQSGRMNQRRMRCATVAQLRGSTSLVPAPHTHPTGEVTGLDAALAGKAALAHVHPTAEVTGLDAALAGKAAAAHTHLVADTPGLQAALDAKAAATVTAAGTGAVARTVVARLGDTVNVKDYGAVGDGVADDSTALENALHHLAATTVESGGTLHIPRNTKIRITRTIEIHSLTDTRPNFLRIKGDNVNASKIIVDFGSGNALQIIGRDVAIEDLTIDAGAARAGGSGSGVYLNKPTGNSFAGRMRMRNVIVLNQPTHGIHLQSPELVQLDTVDSDYNGVSGLFIEKNTLVPAGSLFNGLFENLRCRNNGGVGVHLKDTPAMAIFTNVQSYSNGGARQIWIDGGRCCQFINPDIEDQVSATLPDSVGITLTGQHHSVRGGHFAALTKAIDLISAAHCTIEQPYVSNEAADVAMTAIVAEDANSNSNTYLLKELTSAEMTTLKITAILTQAVTSSAKLFRKRGGVLLAVNFARHYLAVTYAASITPNLDNGGVFAIAALTGDVTIANPTGAVYAGAEIVFRFKQDATGGRAVTSWGSTFRSTGVSVATGTANQERTIKWFYDNADVKWKLVSDTGWL